MQNAKLFPQASLLCLLLSLLNTAVHAKNPTVIIVTASYPGATESVVAALIAVPVERQLNKVEELIRMESISSSDGNYIAHLFFESKADAAELRQRVQNEVDIVKPDLPEKVLINNIFAKPEKQNAYPTQVTLALIDRDNQEWEILRKCSEEVLKPIASAKVINNPTAFPIEVKQLAMYIDGDKKSRLGLNTAEIMQALPVNAQKMKIADLQKLTVGDKKIPLSDIVEIKEELTPSAVFRVNQYHAIRITGAVKDGIKVSEATKKCTELAEAELKRLERSGFSIENLSE